MVRPVEVESTDDVAAAAQVEWPTSTDSAKKRKKVATRGHFHGSLSALAKSAGAGPSITVKVKGTNDPSESETTGEDLATITLNANGWFHGSWANKGYKYVFVDLSAFTNLTWDRGILYLTGHGGTAN